MAITINGTGAIQGINSIENDSLIEISNGINGSHENSFDLRHTMGGACPDLQTPAGSQITPFNGWTKPFGTYTEEFRINSGVAFDSRSAQEQELLTAMGRSGTMHFAPGPIIVFRWSAPSGRSAGDYFGAYYNLKYRTNHVTTCAAFTKLLSGDSARGHWLGGGATSEWSLTGSYYRSGGGGYVNSHPYAPASGNSQAEYLIAMPAQVDGFVDLSVPSNWWFFPNKDGGLG